MRGHRLLVAEGAVDTALDPLRQLVGVVTGRCERSPKRDTYASAGGYLPAGFAGYERRRCLARRQSPPDETLDHERAIEH